MEPTAPSVRFRKGRAVISGLAYLASCPKRRIKAICYGKILAKFGDYPVEINARLWMAVENQSEFTLTGMAAIPPCSENWASKLCKTLAIKNPPKGGSRSRPFHDGWFAAHRWPSLNTAKIASVPIGQFWEHGQAGIEVEYQSSLILKQDSNCLDAGIDFDAVKNLSLDLREAKESCVSPVRTGTLTGSHIRLSKEGDFWLGLHSCSNTNAARFSFRGDLEVGQGKSELPNNSGRCPTNQQKQAIIGQSQFWCHDRTWKDWDAVVSDAGIKPTPNWDGWDDRGRGRG